MPEALAVAAVLFIAIAVYLYAWLESRNSARHNPQQDLVRLRQHAVWLQDRLRLAEVEAWDDEMVSTLNADLELTARELGELTRRSTIC